MTAWSKEHYHVINCRLPRQLADDIKETLHDHRMNWQDFFIAAALGFNNGEWEIPDRRQLDQEEQQWLKLTGGDLTRRTTT